MIVHIMANTADTSFTGLGLSGGDRIFIECARRWAKQGVEIYVHVSEGGYLVCRKNKLGGVKYVILPLLRYKRLNGIVFEFVRIIKSCAAAFTNKVSWNTDEVIVYSASDFWPDSIPAFILKTKYKYLKWIAGFYLFAPRPFSEESPYKGRRAWRGLLYYLSQIPVYWLIKKCADTVFVTNELDRRKFIDGDRFAPNRVIAVRGGVDTKTPVSIPEPRKKKYDAVFIGRFHPQKGVLELIDIWKIVCEKRRNAKLAMIGVGDLEGEIRRKIESLGLKNNVVLFGFKDGIEKLKIFKNSKIVVHPATYDSGGMAPCEAMTCGLPGVSFDLSVLRTYYPKGMLKTPCFDLRAFSENILRLLEDVALYEKLRKDALELTKEWDWDKRAEELLEAIRQYR